jgi:Transposase and inactivated derivatives
MLKDDFKNHQIRIGRDRLRNLLRQNDLLVKPTKRFCVHTTDSNHHYHKWSDLTSAITLNRPHQLWVSDITYLRTKEDGFLYLSLITDAFSRKIIGHHLSYSLSAKGCVSALNKAIGQLPPRSGNGLTHHSDRGVQYCCTEYVKTLQKQHIAISMTQNGSPYENAKAERVNGILKTELGLGIEFENYAAALRAVAKAIDLYNTLRPHFSCGLYTPGHTHQFWKTLQIQPINPKQLSKQTEL